MYQYLNVRPPIETVDLSKVDVSSEQEYQENKYLGSVLENQTLLTYLLKRTEGTGLFE